MTGAGVQAGELAEVQRQGSAVEDRGDDPGAAGQAAGFGGGDRGPAVQGRCSQVDPEVDSEVAEVVQEGVVVDLDEDLGVVGGGAGPAFGGEVFDELAERGAVGLVDVDAVAGAGTAAVVSTSGVPTGSMIRDVGVVAPAADSLVDRNASASVCSFVAIRSSASCRA